MTTSKDHNPMTDTGELVERLLACHLDYEGEPCALINPNGPEAAQALQSKEDECRRLEALLDKYGAHTFGCRNLFGGPCTCGWTALSHTPGDDK